MDTNPKPLGPAQSPVLLGLIAVITGVTLIQWSVDQATLDWMYRAFAVIGGPEFQGIERPLGAAPPYVLHVLLHGGIAHLGFNMFALLGLGAQLIRFFGPGAKGAISFLAFFAFCAVGGAIAQFLLYNFTGESGVAIGASSAISGLLPALGYIMGGWKGAVRNSVVWVLINIAIAFAGAAMPIPLAWAAHIGGVIAGFSAPFFLRWALR